MNPKASEKQLLRTARISSVVIVIGGVFFAFVFPSVVAGLIEVWKVTAYLGIAFWFGVIWKKANRYGALVSAIAMALISIYTGNFLGWPLQHQIALYLPVGIVLMILVSRFTKPEPQEQLRKFYTLLDTPVGKEKRLRDANIEIKLEGQSEGKITKKMKASKNEKIISEEDDDDGLLIVDLLSIRKKYSWRRYKTDLLGFFSAAILALVMIFLALFLAKIGS